MPAYRRGGARVQMVWLDEHYMVMSDGRPLLRVPCSRDELLPPEGKAWECTGHLTRDGEVRDWVRVPELRPQVRSGAGRGRSSLDPPRSAFGIWEGRLRA